MIDSIIWDWNGTLLDDVDLNLRVVNGILARRCLAPLSLEEYRRAFTIPIQGFYRAIGLACEGAEYDMTAREYVAAYAAGLDSCVPTAGVRSLLSNLAARGVACYILSATNHADLIAQVAAVGLEGCFARILGNDDIHGKSKAGKAAVLMKEANLVPDHTVLVGDTIHDFEVAEHIGVRCLLYSRGHQKLPVSDAYRLVDDLSEVIEIL